MFSSCIIPRRMGGRWGRWKGWRENRIIDPSLVTPDHTEPEIFIIGLLGVTWSGLIMGQIEVYLSDSWGCWSGLSYEFGHGHFPRSWDYSTKPSPTIHTTHSPLLTTHLQSHNTRRDWTEQQLSTGCFNWMKETPTRTESLNVFWGEIGILAEYLGRYLRRQKTVPILDLSLI